MKQQERRSEGASVLLTENLINKFTEKKKYFAWISAFISFSSLLVISSGIYFQNTLLLGQKETIFVVVIGLLLLVTAYALLKCKRLLTDLQEYKSQRVFNAYCDAMNRFWKYNLLCAFINCICIPIACVALYFYDKVL